MKKLMIALAMVAVAACAQATTVKWKVAGVTPTGTDATTEGYLMVCLMSADTTGAAAAKLLSTTDAASIAANKGSFGDFVFVTKELTDEGGGTSAAYTDLKSSWIAEQGNPQSGDFYAVIFNAGSIADATAYMVTDPVNVGYAATASGSKTASLSAGTWVDIADTPEPTSGLLLILGVAGLALKRKHA